MLFLIRIDLSKNLNLWKNLRVILSLLGCCFLNNIIESSSVQTKKFSISLWLYRSSSWSVIHQGKFSEKLSSFISLEVCRRSVDHLIAIKLSLFNDIESISLFSLNNDILSSSGGDFSHGVNDNIDIIFIEVAEEDAFFNKVSDRIFSLCTLRDNARNKVSLFVELPKHFSTYSLPTVFFINLLFLLSL